MGAKAGRGRWIGPLAAGFIGLFVGFSFLAPWSQITLLWRYQLWKSLNPDSNLNDVKRNVPNFHFRVHAEVEFDGEPITFDEIVACRGFSIGPKRNPYRGYTLSADGLGRRLADGGALFMRMPRVCSYANRQVRKLKEGDGSGKRLEEVQVPHNHLPYFFWIDDADSPTVAEGYVSEVYFEQPYARMRIKYLEVGPFSWGVPDGRRLLDDSVDSQHPLSIFTLRKQPRFRDDPRLDIDWAGYVVFPIREKEWQRSPTFAKALHGYKPEDGLYSVPAAVRDTGLPELIREEYAAGLSSITAAKRSQMLARSGFGLARYNGKASAGDDAEGSGDGLLLDHIDEEFHLALRRVEEVVPMDCVGGHCEVLEGRRGYYRFQLGQTDTRNPMNTVVFKGAEIKVTSEADLLYDPATRMLWLVSKEAI